MSRKNSRAAKAERRRSREIRHVRGCAVCGDKDVVWVDESGAPDPAYKAICQYHLAYAVATLFGFTDPPEEQRTRPAELWRIPSEAKEWFEVPSERSALTAVHVAMSKKTETADESTDESDPSRTLASA